MTNKEAQYKAIQQGIEAMRESITEVEEFVLSQFTKLHIELDEIDMDVDVAFEKEPEDE